jgi:hypothetical protein
MIPGAIDWREALLWRHPFGISVIPWKNIVGMEGRGILKP